MTGTQGALGYLIARTTVNRIMTQVRRLKRPRYVLMLLFGIGYFWLIFGRPRGSTSALSSAQSLSSGMLSGVAILLTVSVLWMWLFGRTTASLAFLPAEVQLLFSAPITRRALIGYKVIRTQLVVLLNAVIWTLLSGRFGIVAIAPQRFAAAWALFTVLSLHPLGLALMRVAPMSPARRSILAGLKVLAVGIVLVVAVSVWPALSQAGELGFADRLTSVFGALNTSPAVFALAPFRALFAPFVAESLAGFATSFAVVVGIIVLHLAWVLSANVGFEEVAATASIKLATRRAAVKAYQAGGVVTAPSSRKARGRLPLAPTGHPAVAILWKNTLALIRTRMLFSLIVPVLMIVVISSSASGSMGRSGSAGLYLIFAAMLFMMGPRILRNDLRQDMLSLASLKTYPLSGAMMVTAEIASPTLLLWALETFLLAAAWWTASTAGAIHNAQGLGPVLFILVPLAVLVLTATHLAIQNGTALVFPGWVRMGPTAGGIEAMGQNMMMTFGSLFALLLTIILPSIVGGAVFFLTTLPLPFSKSMGVLAGGAAAVLVFAGQLAVMMQWFGRVFDRTEANALI